MSLSAKEEKQRSRALRNQPYSEGTWKLDGRFVRVSATLYPAISWWLEECEAPGIVIADTRRPLAPDEGTRLEAWL